MTSTTVAGGRYLIESTLGHGGMAVVYLARDAELGRPVALKLLAENLTDDGDFRRRFVREARLAARLSHPNVVQVYDAGEDDGRPFIVMEYVPGETLGRVLVQRRNLPPTEAATLARQAALGLQRRPRLRARVPMEGEGEEERHARERDRSRRPSRGDAREPRRDRRNGRTDTTRDTNRVLRDCRAKQDA